MTDMTNSRPLLLVVVTIVLLLLAIAVFWLAAMPQQLLSSLKRNMLDQSGYKLEATAPEISFKNGVALKLNNVSFSNTTANTVTAESMIVTLPVATLFGAGFSAEEVVLNKAVVTLDMSANNTPPELLRGRIVLRESSFRLRDSTTKGVISLSDVNGKIATLGDGSLKADVNFLLNDRLTTFVGEAESAERLFNTGSPADFTVSAPGMLFGFSGQAKFSKGMEFTGQTNVEANDTASMFRWLGMPLDFLEGSGRFKMLSGVSSQGHAITFENLDAKIGGESVTGKAGLKVGPDRMVLVGDVEVSRIALLPNIAVLSQSWSEKPISLSDFTALDLDVTLRAKQLQLRGRAFGPLDAKITSAEQTTVILFAEQKLAGGTVEAGLTFKVKDGILFADTEFKNKAVDAKTLLGGLFGLDALQGPLDSSGLLIMQGKTLAELVSTLAGKLKIEATNLAITNLNIANFLSKPAKGWPASEFTAGVAFEVDMNADVKDGVAVFDRLPLKSGSQNLKLKGEVDILRQAFDVQVGPMLLKGRWVSPEVTTR